MSSTIQ